MIFMCHHVVFVFATALSWAHFFFAQFCASQFCTLNMDGSARKKKRFFLLFSLQWKELSKVYRSENSKLQFSLPNSLLIAIAADDSIAESQTVTALQVQP